MARLPRYFVPGVPLDLIQRGNNRQLIFADDADFTYFRVSDRRRAPRGSSDTCLRPHGQLRVSARHACIRIERWARPAVGQAALRAVLQPALPTHRHPLGRALQVGARQNTCRLNHAANC